MIASALFGLGLRSCALETFRVVGGGMAPAIFAGDILLVSKLYYGIRVPGSGSRLLTWKDIQRGDLVILSGVGEPRVTIARRVVGVPGDTLRRNAGRVEMKSGEDWKVLPCEPIEGFPALCQGDFGQEWRPILREGPAQEPSLKHTEVVLGEQEYYVLSDDRRDGPDSRQFGAVSIESVLGKVLRIAVPSTEIPVDKFPPSTLNNRGYLRPVL
jgi:signal peptidase I